MLKLLVVVLSIGMMFGGWKKEYERDGIKALVLAIVAYFGLFVVISELLFWAELFTMKRCLLICCGISAVFFTIQTSFFSTLQRPVSMPFREYRGVLLVLILGLAVVAGKFEYFGMGQDQGQYQTKAIELMYGNSDRQMDLDEYQKIPDEQRDEFRTKVMENLGGFYNCWEYGEYDTFSSDEFLSEVSGVYHGIPNFPALLALSGGIFGLEHMIDIQTVFWAAAVLLVCFIARNLGLNKGLQVSVTALFALSPVVAWTAKSSLTEPLFAAFVCLYLYFMTEGRRFSAYGAAAATVALSFFHVSMPVYIPAFAAGFLLCYLYGKNEIYLKAGIAALFGFGIGVTSMAYVSPQYMHYNMGYSLYKILPFMNDQNCVLVLWGLVGLGILILFFSRTLLAKAKWSSLIGGNLGKWLIWGMLVFSGGWQIYMAIARKAEYGTIWDAVQHLTFAGNFFVTGILFLLGGYFLAFSRAKQYWKPKEGVILFFFLYCIVIQGCFLRPVTGFYYYYGRYLVPFLPIALLWAGISWNTVRMRYSLAAALGSMVILAPFDKNLIHGMDDTCVEWEALEQMAEYIQAGDSVIVEDSLLSKAYLALRAMTKADFYPVLGGDPEAQVQSLATSEGRVYYLGNATDPSGDAWEICKKVSYRTGQDFENKNATFLPLALEFTEEAETLCLYGISGKLSYEMKEQDFGLAGFGALESDFRWTMETSAEVECFLEPRDYLLTIRQKYLAPFSRTVALRINGELLGEVEIRSDLQDLSFSVPVPKELLRDGRNILTISCELWSASLNNPLDERTLGISVESIRFDPKS